MRKILHFAFIALLVHASHFAPAQMDHPFFLVTLAVPEITLPTDSVMLGVVVVNEEPGSIYTYNWYKISGPDQHKIDNPYSQFTTVSSLVAGTYIFECTVVDYSSISSIIYAASSITEVIVHPAPSVNADKYIKVNLYGGANPYNNPEWNNWNVSTSLSAVALKYSDTTASSINAVLSKSSGINDNGTAYGSGIAPAEVLRYSTSSTTARTLILSGLAPSMYYSVELYGSRNANSGYATIFTIAGAAQSISTYKNLSDKALFSNLLSTPEGKLIVSIESPNAYNYLNGFILTESSTAPINLKPATSAGPDKLITLPADNVVLGGNGSDADGSIVKYTWTKLRGPAQFSFDSRITANSTLSNLVEGTYIFRLTVTDNQGATAFDDVQVVVAPTPPPPGTKLVKVNIYGGVNPYNNLEWNNWNVKSSLTTSGFRYWDSTFSTISAVLSKSEGLHDNGSTYGGSMAPEEVLRYTSSATTERTLTLNGLSSSKTYSLELYASRNNTGNSTLFSMNEISVTIKTDKNKSTKVLFSDLVPNAQGQLVLLIKSVNSYNYLNGFVLTEESTPPPPPPGTKTLKVNLFGGVNPYSNAEWNNWNVAASLSTETLKYSDATLSPIVAVLSKHSAIHDNGTTYGGSMAPPEVLRYASSSATARTLTLSGLSTGKTFNLDLYASRNANSGYVTTFTAGGIVQNISTYQNKSLKASFTNLEPTASGQIVVSIASSNAYNYLNGFILTENPGSAATTLTVSQHAGSGEKVLSKSAFELEAFPNPSPGIFTLSIKSFNETPVFVTVRDGVGRVVERKQYLQAHGTVPLGQTYRPGIYYAEVVQGNQRKTVKLVKTAKSPY